MDMSWRRRGRSSPSSSKNYLEKKLRDIGDKGLYLGLIDPRHALAITREMDAAGLTLLKTPGTQLQTETSNESDLCHCMQTPGRYHATKRE